MRKVNQGETVLTRESQKYRVLIADSSLLVRRGLRTLFNTASDLEVAGEASSAAEALEMAHSEKVHGIVIDAMLADCSPEANIFPLRQLQALAPILFLAEAESPSLLNLVMRVGAFGYLLKVTSAAQIVSTVRRACAGDTGGSEELARTAADLRALASSNAHHSRGASSLTTREQEVLRLLAEGLTVRETATELALSIKTIEAHKLNLMRKLDIHNRASLIEYAVAKGIIQAAAA